MPAETRGRLAIIAVSRPGSELALRLHQRRPEATVCLPARFAPVGVAGVQAIAESTGKTLAGLFAAYEELVVFGSVGLVVRLIAPLLTDKRCDPAVVVVDDAGRFAVSLLSGHLGGANNLARSVAESLGATPVVTTASEALVTLAVDLLGREFGWRLEMPENTTAVSAAVVNGEAVGILQETGELGWWPHDQPLPANLVPCSTWEVLRDRVDLAAAVVITDRLLPQDGGLSVPFVVFRPRSLVVGVGCNRGTDVKEISETITGSLHRHGLSEASIRNLATIAIKRDELGLTETAARLGVPIHYFSAAALASIEHTPNPSAAVQQHIGAAGVCEPAAMLSAGTRQLLVTKTKTTNVTVAIARAETGNLKNEG